MRAWLLSKLRRQCKETMGGQRCLYSLRSHPSFQGTPEHFSGRMWWT